MIERIENICFNVSSFIRGQIDGGLSNCRSFYGISFTTLLLAMRDELDTENKNKLEMLFGALDFSDPEFHWEFNNFALLLYQSLGGSGYQSFLEEIQFKGTPCTNWSLLRACAKILASEDDSLLEVERVKEKLRHRQLDNGLIEDDPKVRSFQYHCFSAALCELIYERTGDEFFYDAFVRALSFIRHFILPNGETLYVGRGQQQSFGYGTLVYILAKGYYYFDDPTLLGDLDRVLSYLERFQRDDGSFPLVLNGIEDSIPSGGVMDDPKFVGWYPYNNYYDYLPFMAVFCQLAYEALTSVAMKEISYRAPSNYSDGYFSIVAKQSYIAVVGRAEGYWSNDLNIPYIYSVEESKSLTPFYGGEQFQTSLYSMKGLPSPVYRNQSFRRKNISFLWRNWHISISIFGLFIQHYIFGDKKLMISNSIFSVLPFKNNFIAFENYLPKISGKVVAASEVYSGCGLLKRFIGGRFNRITYEV